MIKETWTLSDFGKLKIRNMVLAVKIMERLDRELFPRSWQIVTSDKTSQAKIVMLFNEDEVYSIYIGYFEDAKGIERYLSRECEMIHREIAELKNKRRAGVTDGSFDE